jgi:hypothetical protein
MAWAKSWGGGLGLGAHSPRKHHRGAVSVLPDPSPNLNLMAAAAAAAEEAWAFCRRDPARRVTVSCPWTASRQWIDGFRSSWAGRLRSEKCEECSLRLEGVRSSVTQLAPSLKCPTLYINRRPIIARTSRWHTTQAGLMPDQPGGSSPHGRVEFPVDSCRHPKGRGCA